MDNVKTLGEEIYFEKELGKMCIKTLANSFIHTNSEIDDKEYRGDNNMAYLLKTSVQYNNPKLFNLSINFIGRPGKLYTPVVGSQFHEPSGCYEPIFSNDFLSAQYANYNRIDLSLSRYFGLNRNAIVAFVSVNNLLNSLNQKNDIYNFSFSSKDFDYYTRRSFYFGLVWYLSR
jgi:hypothetical protein